MKKPGYATLSASLVGAGVISLLAMLKGDMDDPEKKNPETAKNHDFYLILTIVFFFLAALAFLFYLNPNVPGIQRNIINITSGRATEANSEFDDLTGPLILN
jgi:hypothetical protein